MARWRVGQCVVDDSDGTVASADRVVRLEPKVMQVLLALMERRGTLVPHDALFASVWSDAHVAPTVLTRAISLVRAALGDDPYHPRYLETLSKRGYRLIAAVDAVPEPHGLPVPPPPSRRRAAGPALGAAAAVVLVALTLGPETPRTQKGSTAALHGPRLTHQTREGNEIAYAHYMRAVALDASSAEAYAGLATAYAFRGSYLPDRFQWAARAVDVATRATRLDPRSAKAARALGVAHAWAGRNQLALAQFRRALQLAPDDPYARANVGRMLLTSGRVVEGLEALEQQITAFPSVPDGYTYLASGLTLAGHGEQAPAVARVAVALEPYAPQAQLALVRDDLLAARYEAARMRLERLLEVRPDCAQCLVQLGLIEQLEGRVERAESRYRAAQAISPPFPPASLRLAQLRGARGRRAEAEALLATVEAAARAEIESGSENHYPRWQLAALYAVRGDERSAMAWYAQAVSTGRRDAAWDEWDPLLTGLRREPAFAALHERLRTERQAAALLVLRLSNRLASVQDRRPVGLMSVIPDPPGWPAAR
jgi:transcriptional activator of cad operon